MAKLSRNARHKARQKRTISLAYRQLRGLQADLGRTHMTLLAVLAEAGGTFNIKTETMMRLNDKWQGLTWMLEAAPKEEGQPVTEWVLKLVTTGE